MKPIVNPYESPQAVEHEYSTAKHLATTLVVSRLRTPVYGLLVVSIVHIVALSALLTRQVLWELKVASTGANLQDAVEPIAIFAVYFAAWSIPALFQLFITRRALKLESLGPCRLTALIACIPVLSPCLVLGIPFGIWATFILFQRSTVAAFDHPLGLTEQQAGVNRGLNP